MADIARIRWTLRLRLLTRAFVGGARPREADPITPLRPTSLRGVWRQWFRYAAAAALQNRGEGFLEDLRTMESAVFGDTVRGSRVLVGAPSGATFRGISPPDRQRNPGLRYLGYGIFDDPQQIPEFVEPDREITLRGAIQGPKGELEPIANAFFATLWLWGNFGGIGARSRRGWGAPEIIALEGSSWSGPAFGARAKGRKELLGALLKGLDDCMPYFTALARDLELPVAQAGDSPPVDLRTLAGIRDLRALPASFGTANEAMEAAGRIFQDFRSTLRRNDTGRPPLPDYFEVKAALQGEPDAPRTVDRAVFGLPLPFFFRSLGNAKAEFVPDEPGADRLPSPLLFRVHRLADGRYCVVLIDLAGAENAQHLSGKKLRFKRGRGGIAAPGKRLMTQFLEWADSEARRRYPEAR